MNCDDLARSGADLGWPWLLLLALALVVVGVLVVGRRRGAAVGLMLALCLAGSVLLAPAPSAQAGCATPSPVATNSLTIVQTSTNDGMGPAVAPSIVAGRITNNGPDDTYVEAVTVSIASVTPAVGASAGSCDASDYVLIDPRMAVDRELLAGGGSAVFSGARIGFLDKPGNQDACKRATVELRYVTG